MTPSNTTADVPPAPSGPAAAVVPLLRGVSHQYTSWVALAAGIVLVVAVAEDARARVASVVYAIGLCALFSFSALYHRWRGDPRWKPLLRRIDHSTIFVFIAASTTPVALLVLSQPLRTIILLGVWLGAIAGLTLSIAWITAPRWLVAGSYLFVGWMGAIATPQLIDKLPAAPLVLLAAGGLLYSAGAVVYARQHPDPWPQTFGFHEVFHALVIAAAVVHFVAMSGWVIPLR